MDQERYNLLSVKAKTCQKCPGLCEHRIQAVFGCGNLKSSLVILGEAPGRDEDEQGEPFVGRSGKLLTNILLACNIHRQDVYISNACKCRPPNNRTPTTEEIHNCNEFLYAELQEIRPKVVLCLGQTATTALLKVKESIGRLRGKVHKIYDPIEVDVIATYHPSFLLRNPSAKQDVWNDLQLLLKVL